MSKSPVSAPLPLFTPHSITVTLYTIMYLSPKWTEIFRSCCKSSASLQLAVSHAL